MSPTAGDVLFGNIQNDTIVFLGICYTSRLKAMLHNLIQQGSLTSFIAIMDVKNRINKVLTKLKRRRKRKKGNKSFSISDNKRLTYFIPVTGLQVNKMRMTERIKVAQ